jgi:SAM-dependent methyltransferase
LTPRLAGPGDAFHTRHASPEARALPAPPDLPALIHAVTARYAGASRYTRHYVRTKLRRDPATGAILALARRQGGFGAVADLGCGRGQLALALLLGGGATSIIGLDHDAPSLRAARHAGTGLPARFDAADLSAGPLPPCDTVLLVDVLYQLPDAAQHDLLARIAAAARRRLVIRAFDPDCGWRSRFGRVMEVLNRALHGRHAASIRPMPLPALRALLELQGFRVSVMPCWAGTPLPNVLLLAERGAG